MIPVDTKTGKPWNIDNANAKLDQIRRETISDLCARTERLTGGRCSAANGYKCYSAVAVKDTGGKMIETAKMEIDPELSRLRHTGREVRLLTRKRWAQFCSEPQSEEDVMASIVAERRREQITIMTDAYDREYGDGQRDDRRGVTTPRKRGRPKGSKNKTQEPSDESAMAAPDG